MWSTVFYRSEGGELIHQLIPIFVGKFREGYNNPETGRFLTRDPARDDSLGNLYAFVNNNPVNAIDPWGLDLKSLRDIGKEFLWLFNNRKKLHPEVILEAGLSSGVRLFKETLVTISQFRKDIEDARKYFKATLDLAVTEVMIENQNYVLNPTNKQKRKINSMIADIEECFFSDFAAQAGQELATKANISCFKEGMKWGNPSKYKNLLSGKDIAKHFSDEATSHIKMVGVLSKLLRVASLVGVGWNVYDANKKKKKIDKLSAYTSGAIVGLSTAIEMIVWQMAKHEVIKETTKRGWTKVLGGPISMTILIGQVGQIGIKISNIINNYQLRCEGEKQCKKMLQSHRRKLLSQIRSLRITGMGNSGIMQVLIMDLSNEKRQKKPDYFNIDIKPVIFGANFSVIRGF